MMYLTRQVYDIHYTPPLLNEEVLVKNIIDMTIDNIIIFYDGENLSFHINGIFNTFAY